MPKSILNHLRRCAMLTAVTLFSALAGCGHEPAAPQGEAHTAATAGSGGGGGQTAPAPLTAQAGETSPGAAGAAGAPGAAAGVTASQQGAPQVLSSPYGSPSGSGAAGAPGQPRTNELLPLAQGVAAPTQPPAAAPAAGDLAVRERQLADRQAALDAREARLRRREATQAPPAGGPAGSSRVAGVTGGANGESLQASPAPSSNLEPPPYDPAAGAVAGAGGDRPAGADQPGDEAAAAGAGAPGSGGGGGVAPAPSADDRQRAAAVTVPAGTPFEVAFTRGLASNTSSVGDTFRARILSDVRLDGATAIPAGSEVLGVVTEAVATRRIGGKAKLSVKFTDLVLPSGSTVPVHASFLEEGKSKTGRDAATIGGSAAGGALLGRILGQNGRGTILGALVGAAVGTAIASKTAGDEVVIPEGSVVKLKLDEPLDLRDRR